MHGPLVLQLCVGKQQEKLCMDLLYSSYVWGNNKRNYAWTSCTPAMCGETTRETMHGPLVLQLCVGKQQDKLCMDLLYSSYVWGNNKRNYAWTSCTPAMCGETTRETMHRPLVLQLCVGKQQEKLCIDLLYSSYVWGNNKRNYAWTSCTSAMCGETARETMHGPLVLQLCVGKQQEKLCMDLLYSSYVWGNNKRNYAWTSCTPAMCGETTRETMHGPLVLQLCVGKQQEKLCMDLLYSSYVWGNNKRNYAWTSSTPAMCGETTRETMHRPLVLQLCVGKQQEKLCIDLLYSSYVRGNNRRNYAWTSCTPAMCGETARETMHRPLVLQLCVGGQQETLTKILENDFFLFTLQCALPD